MQAVITGWGYYVPPKVLTNADLEAMVNTSDAWIYERTGIRERHIVEGDEVTSGMATKAAKEALARAKVRAEDLDAIIIATTSPDYFLPTAACLVQEGLRARKAAVFDLGAARAGFVYGRAVARGLLMSAARSRDDAASDYIQMDGSAVFKLAVPAMADAAKEALGAAGLGLEDVDLFVPHQANARIIEAVAKRLGLDRSKVFMDIDRFGNTSAASIPIALCDAVDQGRVRLGDTLVFAAFGGGMTWGAAVVEWTRV